jgi:hypothetical protein
MAQGLVRKLTVIHLVKILSSFILSECWSRGLQIPALGFWVGWADAINNYLRLYCCVCDEKVFFFIYIIPWLFTFVSRNPGSKWIQSKSSHGVTQRYGLVSSSYAYSDLAMISLHLNLALLSFQISSFGHTFLNYHAYIL